MNIRQRYTQGRSPLASLQPTQPAPEPLPGKSKFKRRGYREFHPVTSTLVILGSASVAFLATCYVTYCILHALGY